MAIKEKNLAGEYNASTSDNKKDFLLDSINEKVMVYEHDFIPAPKKPGTGELSFVFNLEAAPTSGNNVWQIIDITPEQFAFMAAHTDNIVSVESTLERDDVDAPYTITDLVSITNLMTGEGAISGLYQFMVTMHVSVSGDAFSPIPVNISSAEGEYLLTHNGIQIVDAIDAPAGQDYHTFTITFNIPEDSKLLYIEE
jgi:hypothetical protein